MKTANNITFALVIFSVAAILALALAAIVRSKSELLTGIAFFIAVACLLWCFEKAFPSVYRGLRRQVPWWQTRAGLRAVTLVLGLMISILSSRAAAVWFGLLAISGLLGALSLRATRKEDEL